MTLHKDGKTVTVTDDGRGIPVDVKAKYKKSALELILTTLHAGGKFEQGNYLHSGGLHGVGAAVVNALPQQAPGREVTRDGDAGTSKLRARQGHSPSSRWSGRRAAPGTTITFTPDAEIFGEKLRFDAELIRERLEAKSLPAPRHGGHFRDEAARPARR